MHEEMKVRYGDVESTIAKMENTSQALEHSLPKNMASGNVLNVVEKLNQLNQLLEEQGEEYKSILKMNNEIVRTTLQTLKETDENLSSSIKAR